MLNDDFEDLENPPEGVDGQAWGMFLCQLGLLQVFTQSEVKRDGNMLRYYFAGLLRGEARVNDRGLPDGAFTVWYKDGKTVWITGSYTQGRKNDDWQVFLPDGQRLEPQPVSDWMH